MTLIRVFMITASFFPEVGGVQTQALLQSQGLRTRGCEVTLITLRHQRAWPAQEIVQGVPVQRVAGLFLYKRTQLPRLLQRVCYLLALLALSYYLWRRRSDYDLLHVQQMNLIALPAAFVARLTGKPLILVMHSSAAGKSQPTRAVLCPGPLDPSLPWLAVAGLQHNRSDLDLLARAGRCFPALLRLLIRSVPVRVVILSSRMHADLSAHGFSAVPVTLIPNGVDTRRFVPRSAPLDATQMPVVICMARLEYVKGIDVLLQAWKRVQDRLPTPAHLLLVGDGSLRPQLERLTRALALTAYVEFAGLRTDTVAQWQRGSLCVLPSRREGMPAALLEAMACALPCVATRVSGSEDLIQSGYNGLLVEPDDDGSLADALLQLLLDAELRTRYGWAARAMVEQHYTLEHMLHRYLELYDALVQPLGLVLSGTASAK